MLSSNLLVIAMKKILIINGNPKQESLTRELANAYELGAQRENIRRYDLSELEFDPNLRAGYDEVQELEECLIEVQNSISWCDHVCVVAPVWWGSLPAKLKGLIDRVFLPGFSFKYEEGGTEPIKLLSGKTSSFVFTMDAPEDYLKEQARSVLEQLDTFTFKFCGIENTDVKLFGSAIMADESKRESWNHIMFDLGRNIANN